METEAARSPRPEDARRPIVFFDLETGGVEPKHPDIQLAAVAVDLETWEELAQFERKIRFNVQDADPEALRINHFDLTVWDEQAWPEGSVASSFSKFLNSFRSVTHISKRTGKPYTVAKLAGHYAADFDGPRLKRLFQRHDLFLPADPRIRCTVQRALWWFEETGKKLPENFKLATLCEYFGIPTPEAHEALADVRCAVSLARAMALPHPVETTS